MAAIQVNRTTNANVYLNGNSLLGKVSEATAPTLKTKFADVEALGMVGSLELPTGLDKLELKLKFNAIYADVLAAASNPFQTQEIQIRGSIETYTTAGRVAQVPSVIYVRGTFKDNALGNFKQHANVDLGADMNVIAIKHEIDGRTVTDIDVLANIWKVNGVDILAQYRQNIGG